jgi:hypothetical protein
MSLRSVLVCDRCGAEGASHGSSSALDSRGGKITHSWWPRRGNCAEPVGTATYDLCHDCEAAFVEWLKNGKTDGQ